jgi:hypothetical protein
MSDLFNSIKTTILGTKTTEIDKDIDASFRSIETYSISRNKNRYIETLRNLISATGAKTPDDLIKGLQTQGGAQVETYDQTGRIGRYSEYDAIVNKISYCQRALETLTDNILSPDDITKDSLVFLKDPAFSDSENAERAIRRLKEIEKKLKIDKRVKSIVRTTLLKGDNFVEIVCSPKGQNALTILREGKEVQIPNTIFNIGDPFDLNIKYNQIKESTNANNEKETEECTFKTKVQLEVTAFGGVLTGMGSMTVGTNISPTGYAQTSSAAMPTSKSKDQHQAEADPKDVGEEKPEFKSKFSDADRKDLIERLKLKDVFLAIHNPRFVIRLETMRFRTCLGYLVFPAVDPRLVLNNSLLAAGPNSIDALCTDIINKVQALLKNRNDEVKLSDDMKNVILRYLTYIKNNEDLKVRYVPPELMVHWRENPERFDPYGESIFESVNFDSRLLMALKTATTIKRLTYASDKRIISVETGLPRDAKNIIESIKEGLNKRKISINNMGSIDSIPSQIPTFETIYIPMRDGKKFVEFERQEWGHGNPQEDVEPMKFMRDNIVASLGVPAPYLGLEENMSNRSLLTVENINFCRTIIGHQKVLSVPLKETFEKIYKILYPEDEDIMDIINITFPEPKVSPYEHQMEYIEQMQRLIEALKSLGVPVNWLKKKYLPNIDWEEIEKFSAEETIDRETAEQPPDNNQLGGVMGGGGIY